MKDLKIIQEFFSKPLKENTLKVGDKVSKKYASTEDDYTREFEIISIEKDRAKVKDLKTGKTTGMSLSDLTKESLKEDMFGNPLLKILLPQIFKEYTGKMIEMDFTDPESDWSKMLGKLEKHLPGDQLSDFMSSKKLDKYLDDYNIRLIDPIVDKEIDPEIVKRGKAKIDIDAMRKAANMPPLDSIASLNEEKSFANYSNNELLAYYKNTKDPKAKEELIKRAQKLKNLTRTDEAKDNIKVGDKVKVDGGDTYERVEGTVGGYPAFYRVENGKRVGRKTGLVGFIKMDKVEEAIDVNDPALARFRAQMAARKKKAAEPKKSINPNYAAVKNADKIRALKQQRAQIMIDMEQEAEPEGGPIANRYGNMLNKIDMAITKLSGQGKGDEYMSKDEIERRAAMIRENKPVANPNKHIKGIQIQLDQLGVKYEMSGNEFKPFKVIYKPVNKDNEWYDNFNDIIFRYNLEGAVEPEKPSLSIGDIITKDMWDEKKIEMGIKDKAISDREWFKKPHKIIDFNSRLGMISFDHPAKPKRSETWVNRFLKDEHQVDFSEYPKGVLSVVYSKGRMNEATEDAIDTITMDIPLFLRMLEYAREDAENDLDLHDVTEKAVAGTKQQGVLSMDDYDMLTGELEQLAEAFVPSNIREFAKRKGVTKLVNTVAGWAEEVGKKIVGGVAVGRDYDTLVLDLDFKQQGEIRIDCEYETVELYDKPVRSLKAFKKVFNDYNKEEDKPSINEATEDAIYYLQQAIKLSHTNTIRKLILKAIRELGLEVPKVWTESVSKVDKKKGKKLTESKYLKYADLIDLVNKADNPRNLPIYYNSDFGVVNIGGVGYDKGELVKMFRSKPGTSLNIKNIFFKANQNPEQTAKDVNSFNMGVKAEVDYGYGKEPFIKFTKGYSDEFLDQEMKTQMSNDEETLRRERGLEEIKQRIFNKLKK